MTETTGHNHVSKDQLRSIIERVERVSEEIKGLRSDVSDIFKEAGGNGYDVKALRRVVAIRKMDAGKHQEFENVVDAYMSALGA